MDDERTFLKHSIIAMAFFGVDAMGFLLSISISEDGDISSLLHRLLMSHVLFMECMLLNIVVGNCCQLFWINLKPH